MKTKLIALLAVLLFSAGANAQNAPANGQQAKKILIAYFSWGGNTQHVAEHIAAVTGGTAFPSLSRRALSTSTHHCTEIARPKKKPMPAPPSKRKSKIGSYMIRYSLAVPYGGGQLR